MKFVCIESDTAEKIVEDRLCLFVSSPIRLKRLSMTGNVWLYRVRQGWKDCRGPVMFVCIESDKAEKIVEDQ